MGKIKVKGNNEKEPNYEILEYDLQILPVVKILGNLSQNQRKAILFVMGLDVAAGYTKVPLGEGVIGYRSRVTGEVVFGQHSVYQGREREDCRWLNSGQDNAYRYLAGEKMSEFLAVIKGD